MAGHGMHVDYTVIVYIIGLLAIYNAFTLKVAFRPSYAIACATD